MHEFEVAHDTRLLQLLSELSTRRMLLDTQVHYLFNEAAEFHVDHMGRTRDRQFRGRGKLEDLPDGTLYEQSQTFVRGEAGFYVRDSSHWNHARRAKVGDARAKLTDDNEYVIAYNAAKDCLDAAVFAVRQHELAYTGWARFFLVVSSPGHVHSSMNCSTCRPTTTYAPVVALSAHTEAEAIALLGNTLCSTCFPSVKGKPSKITAAQARKLVSA